MKNSINKISKDDLIQQILKKSKAKSKDETLFYELLLQTMSVRTLMNMPDKELIRLIKDRYSFFESQKTGPLPSARLIKSPYSFDWIKDQYIFEIVTPDVPFLFQTLENLLLKHDVRITRKLHPIIGINSSHICSPCENNSCLSSIFFAFEEIPTPLLKKIEKMMVSHCKMVVTAYESTPKIENQIQTVIEKINSSTPKCSEPKEEWVNLLNWLQDLNFSFFGSAHIDVKKGHIASNLSPNLGILNTKANKAFPEIKSAFEAHIAHHHKESDFQFDRLKCKSPIQRFEPLMHLRFAFDSEEYHFVGLLRRSSLLSKNIKTPLIHLKMKHILESRQLLEGSHDYNEVLRIFTAIPKYELFRSSQALLLTMIDDILSITNPNHIQTTFHSLSPKQLFCLMVIPPFMFTVENIKKIKGYLEGHIPIEDIEILQIQAEGRCRLHIYLQLQSPLKELPNPELIERQLGDLLVPWHEKVKLEIYRQFPKEAEDLIHLVDVLPHHYCVRTRPSGAAEDLYALSRLSDQNPVEFRFKLFNYPPESDLAGKVSILKIFSQKKIDLITIMPILQNLGFYVIDELTARFSEKDETLGFILSFRVQDHDKSPIDDAQFKDLITDLLVKVFNGELDNDPLNKLLLSASLSGKEIAILIMYRNFYIQLCHSYSKSKLTRTLNNHPKISRFLVRYFLDKFNPKGKGVDLDHLQQSFKKLLKPVSDLSEDTIFRRIFSLITHSVRSNYFQDTVNIDFPFALKCHSQHLDFIPNPKPEREIFIYDRLVEGTHLRFGPVARGGIRWSDRDDDFRTEILGLVKTQQVKNVVIVPVGSKGGFIAKQNQFYKTPDQIDFHYRRFVKGLLSITDNRSKNKVIHPKKSKIYDEKDPYFVIAADKGTAKFSDVANDVSQSHGFWLDDAFASGGSNGYDHKKVGITAKGAWTCGLRHFLEQGWAKDKVLTCIGIGDMSGDVFGNGMLLSNRIQLLGAFNHMHIFVDPDPDPKKSFKERQRLFDQPRSTWKDYQENALSAGAGIYDRNAKQINLSKAAMQALGITDKSLSGQDLIKAILKAPVDFIWFGGIGTYIKADFESNSEVGDHANDDVRINANEARATIVAEGANLGLTQKARLQYSLNGGQINTDAIDNSAGVNMSDYEVNIKILMQELIAKNAITMSKRNQLLEAYTDAVTDKVLDNNDHQHQLISLDQIRSKEDGILFKNLIESLCQQGNIDRVAEDIPDSETLDEWVKDGLALPRPLISVIQAYIKMAVLDSIVSSKLMQDPYFEPLLLEYFPEAFSNSFKSDVLDHPLKDNIIATVLSNRIVNYAGSSILYELRQLTAADDEQIIQSYLLVESMTNAPVIRDLIRKSDAPVESQYEAILHLESIIKSICRDMLQSEFDIQLSELESLKSMAASLINASTAKHKHWIDKGFDTKTATLLTQVQELESLPEALNIQVQSKLKTADICCILKKLNEELRTDWLEQSLKTLTLNTHWEREQQALLKSQLFDAKCQIVLSIKAKHRISSIQKKPLSMLVSKDKLDSLMDYLESVQLLEVNQETPSLLSLTVLISKLSLI